MPKKQGENPDRQADAYAASSVDNALRTLVYLRGHHSVRVTDISDHLGVARSTAHRLLTTLRGHGFVEQEPGGRRYRLGPVLLGLTRGPVDEPTLVQVAHCHLARLRDEVGETTNLLVLDGPDSRFADGVEGRHPLRVGPRNGDRVPAYGTAGGKALLSELSPESARTRYRRGLTPLTASTLPDVDALIAELAVTRARGYALNLDESVVGVHGVGVRVRDRFGTCVAALTVAAPSIRLDPGRAAELAPLLRETAERIASEL
ncbi:IclR family transcriptional regulator [Streptomyces sp. WMMB 322]|uniref:IclR family transcriptional regulator n=1 Tax=Streptomyces sp. WMMB 322 TaxID=1286821 RepID=UPI0006E1631F|nr:IclR family transcriptional regulator [Streptomyces sp. WMMB 322]SCK39958.1 transcriptional regulator, IclR family [Streptomyces sp. WMMB 322]